MNKERMKLWLKILKSGKYKPTSGNYLCKNEKYTPIGALMCSFHKDIKLLGNGIKGFDGHYSGCSEKIAKWLGFTDRFYMYNINILGDRFGRFFENDAGHKDWSKCIQAIEKLING